MKKNITKIFERFAAKVTKATGKPLAFIFAFLIIKTTCHYHPHDFFYRCPEA